jgi:hypothetical protein
MTTPRTIRKATIWMTPASAAQAMNSIGLVEADHRAGQGDRGRGAPLADQLELIIGRGELIEELEDDQHDRRHAEGEQELARSTHECLRVEHHLFFPLVIPQA